MKSLLVLICCVALATGVLAAPQDTPKKKQAAAAPQQQAQAAKPAKQARQAAKAQRQMSRAPFRSLSGGQSSAPKKQQKFQTQSSELPAVQSNRQLRRQDRLEQKQEKLDAQGGLSAKQFRRQERREARQFKLSEKPKTELAANAVKFREGRRIEGSERWQGEHYRAFRNYRGEWHDRDWWHHHHSRIVFILGGWYFWNHGFWYPAWGYDPYAYYPYDGPIYAYNDLPPDQVVANVQAELQAQGYYHGEVDGLLGPLTRAAIANYQRDRGLYITSAIDRPTMEALGFA
jgi:hypothetical protein